MLKKKEIQETCMLLPSKLNRRIKNYFPVHTENSGTAYMFESSPLVLLILDGLSDLLLPFLRHQIEIEQSSEDHMEQASVVFFFQQEFLH